MSGGGAGIGIQHQVIRYGVGLVYVEIHNYKYSISYEHHIEVGITMFDIFGRSKNTCIVCFLILIYSIS